MIAVSARTVPVCVFLVLSLCACSKPRPSTFESEAHWLQAVWAGDAVLKHTGTPRGNASWIEETWDYQFSGGPEAAVKLFRSHTPMGYTIVRQTDSELLLSRFDGHDSYQLTLTFEDSIGQKTTATVNLKSFPD